MHHSLGDVARAWQGNLKKLIFIVGLLSTLDVSLTEDPVSSSNLDQRFCNQTHKRFSIRLCHECTISVPCDPEYTVVRMRTCPYVARGISLNSSMETCIAECVKVYTTRDCCHGLWGDDCNEECPGGRQNPCNGHGKCSSKNGGCACHAGFVGISCELCKDSTKYGPNCLQDCTCENGTCNNGVHGDGLCKQDNPCQRSVCGANSYCNHTGPGRHTCTCEDGYAGDGMECTPINPCQNNSGGCHVTTDCIYTGPNQHRCQCKEGYEGYTLGKGCKLKDMCTPGLCGPHAVCETRQPLKHSCDCNKGYSWNGAKCIGNIIETLKELHDNHALYNGKLNFMEQAVTRLYANFLSTPGPFTIFVPTDTAFTKYATPKSIIDVDDFTFDDDEIKSVLLQHIVAGRFLNNSTSSFYNLLGNLANVQTNTVETGRNATYYTVSYDNSTKRERAKFVESNLLASNGVIHITDEVIAIKDSQFEDKQKTIMDLLKNHPDYSTMYSMIMAAGLSAEFSQPNTTVLIPNNKAWDSPLLREKYYLKYDADGLIKLRVILLHHVFPGVIDVTDLIRAQDMKSYANVIVKVELSNQGQIQLDGNANITKANIPVRTGLCHRVDKVIVPSYLIPLVNNVCEVTETKKVQGPCGVECFPTTGCQLSTDTPTRETAHCTDLTWYEPDNHWFNRHHSHWMRPYFRKRRSEPDWFPPLPYRSFSGGSWHRQRRCSIMCLRKVTKRTCCEGFYGRSCIPCPGGFKNPCSGNGKCSKDATATSVCVCNANFFGTNCERCARNNTFGGDCKGTCTCQFGQCDTGIYGSGRCKPGTCQLGYTGENCDKKLLPCDSDEPCPVNSTCYLGEDGVESCLCAPGFEEVSGDCSEIDLCVDNRNPCHKQATCSHQGPGSVSCTCNNGWHGDGFYCMPNHPCDGHTDCHRSAVCQDLEPGQYRCICKTGYRGNGLACTIVDLCVENNGGCHPKAKCTFIKEGERNCSCPDFMTGDGFTCIGTIAVEIMKHPDLTRLRDLMKIVNNSNNILDMVNTSFTFFAPTDSALRPFVRNQNRPEYWTQEENVLSLINFHTINDEFSTDDLMALDGVIKNYPTLYNGFSLRIVKTNSSLHIFSNYSKFAKITKANISAFNGVFHIVDQVLEPFLPDSQEPSLNDTLSSQPRYQLFYEALQKTNLLEVLTSLDEYTLFVLPNNVVREINRKITADFLKFYVVPKRVFTPSMSDDNVDTLLGPLHRLSFTVFPKKVLVNGIKITHKDILTDVGVIHEIEGVLHPVLNRCDFNISETALGPCGDCTSENLTCPDEFTPLETPQIMKYRCHFHKFPNANWEEIGCQQICIKHSGYESVCCGGYYGQHCDECPGSAEYPCSGNGICDEGEKGSGRCKCNRGFSGELCESCQTTDLVPPYCNTSYYGCRYMNGNCSEHAKCLESIDGVTCQCFSDYKGDGHTCTSYCYSAEHGGCHPQAKCGFNPQSRPAHQCECIPGFHGNGTWCQPNSDPCSSHNGGCDLERATCHFTEPKVTDMDEAKPLCRCQSWYVGDGTLCSSDLLDAITRTPFLRLFHSWLKTAEQKIQTKIAELFGDRRKTMTVFFPVEKFTNITSFTIVDGIFRLPNYPGIEDEINSSISTNNSKMDYIKQWTMKSLNGQVIKITLNDQGMYHVNGVRIVQGNLEALNGILHLTAAPLASYEGVMASKSTAPIIPHSNPLIAIVTTAVIAMLMALITILIYKKRRHLYIFRHKPTIITGHFRSSQSTLDFNQSPPKIITTHFTSSQPTSDHHNPLQIITTHFRSSQPTSDHHNPLQIITDFIEIITTHFRSSQSTSDYHRLYSDHHNPLQINTTHFRSSQPTSYHQRLNSNYHSPP